MLLRYFWFGGAAALALAACALDFDRFEAVPAGSGGATASGGSTGAGGECTSAADCPGDAVCDPATHTCVDGLPCATHTDCGAQAFCDNGICKPNTIGGPCDEDINCAPPETCTGNVCGCGGELYGADNVPPNMLIVLDRSSSMNEMITGGTKWNIARQAIDSMVTMYGGGVYFGLMLYPGTDQSGSQGMSCGPGAVFVDPAPMTATTITTFLNGAGTTSFGTPTAEALDTLVDYPGLEDTTRPNYILLITDGQSTCNDPVASVTALRAETPEIQTFVVGFGSGVDPTELNAMAQAGGTAQAQMPYYYQADDAASLAAAFASIAGTVLSCSYALSEVPPDPNQLYVYVDGMAVPRDPTHMNGWDYDPVTNTITFYGAVCDLLASGTVTDLVISYGCPIDIVE